MAGIVIPINTAAGRKELDLLQREFKQTGDSALKAGKSLHQVENKVKKGLGAKTGVSKLASFNQGLKSTAKSLLGIQGIMAGFTLAAVVTAIGVTGARFEKEMATVGAVTRATAKEFKMLEDQARKMGATTEFTATEAAGALRFLGMAGFDATKAAGALPGVLDLATASGVDLARSADIASNALTAMQLEVGELGRVNDTFIATMTRSNVDMEMLAESFKYSAPLAQALGYDVEQLSAMIGILGNAGIQGSMAGTQLAFAMQQLPKVFKELGINGEGKNLIDAMEGMNEAGWDSERVMKVFGQRGGRAVLVLRQLIPQYKALEEANRNAKGESQKLADTIRDTVIGDFNTLKSTLESLAIDTFKQYRLEIRAALQGTTKYFREHKTEILATVKGIGDLIVALGKAIGKLAQWTGAFTKGLSEVSASIGQLAGERGITLTDVLDPAALGTKLGAQTKDPTALNFQDIFTGAGVTKRAIKERQESAQMAEARKKMAEARNLMSRGDVDQQLASFFGEVDTARQSIIDKQAYEKARTVGGEGPGGYDMTSADRNKRDKILQQWNETKETYRLSDTELELRSLQQQYEIYAQHLADKKELDVWYQNEKTNIVAEGAARQAEQEKENKEKISGLVNEDLSNFFMEVDEAEAKIQETKGVFDNFTTDATDSLATGLTDTIFNLSGGFDQARMSFGQFATDFVRQMTMMIAKQILFNSISSLLGGTGGGASGIGGMLTGLFSRAGGGDVSPNQSYWVGERGPEKFTPETKGTIEPANSQPTVNVSIANLMDPSMINEYLTSSAGQGAILNVISQNPDELKR